MTSAADQWTDFRHANVDSPHKGSNWAGVTRGGELLLHLAANREPGYGDRSERIALCIRDLQQHIATAYGPSGWTQEGLGYLQYTFGFLAPAVYASGDPELQQRFRAITWHRLAMHAFPFFELQMSLQSGVDSGATFREGFASLIFPTVPPADLPYYRYWYDRHIGILAQQPRYDDHRAATVWAILFYPNVPAAKPPPTWGGSLLDSQKGAFYFRNRWRDQNDILLSVMNRNDHHSHAWNQHETFQLSIMALNANFAAGPGKERDIHLYSKPILDGKRDASLGRGRTLRAEPGYVVLDGSENFGIAKAERRMRTQFSGDSAVITLWDQFHDSNPHTLWWQLRPGQGVTAEAVTGEPLPAFLLRKGDAYLKGWIQTSVPVAITAVAIATDTVLRLDLGSAPRHDLLVVLVLGRGTPPNAAIADQGIRVLGRTYRRQDLPQ
jgi:hypothetical protein